MKRRDFIDGVASLAAVVGLGSSAVVQETFLEKLKRLGCTMYLRQPDLRDDGSIRYSIRISHPSGFGCITYSDSYDKAYESIKSDFDVAWRKNGPKTT